MASFTKRYNGFSNKLLTNVIVTSGHMSSKCLALWDTGATCTCISDRLATVLSLEKIGYTRIQTPSGFSDVKRYLVNIGLPNKTTIENIVVCDSKIGEQGFDVLIGMDIITLGDFAVSNYGKRTVFSYRVPSKETTDYVQQEFMGNVSGRKS